jgi:hypothetical protein
VTLSAALVVLAGFVLVIGPILGAALFRPGRARGVKIAEAELTGPVIEQIRYRHPEIVRTARLDRHDAYVWLHIGFLGYGLSALLAPYPNTNVATLSGTTQQALGLCLLVGGITGVTGIIMGARISAHRRIMRRVARHLFSDVLGDDIRLPYRLGVLGLMSVGVSMINYGGATIATSHGRPFGILGGSLAICIAGMCITLSIRFVARVLAYNRAHDKLLAEYTEFVAGTP